MMTGTTQNDDVGLGKAAIPNAVVGILAPGNSHTVFGNWRQCHRRTKTIHGQPLQQGFSLVRYAGDVVAFGLPTRPIEFDIANSVIFKGITVHGIVGRKMWDTWVHSDELLLNKTVDLTPIVTHTYRLDEFDKAFATMESGESGKVMMWVS